MVVKLTRNEKEGFVSKRGPYKVSKHRRVEHYTHKNKPLGGNKVHPIESALLSALAGIEKRNRSEMSKEEGRE